MRNRRESREHGSALVYALVFIILVATITAAVMSYALTARKASQSHVQRGGLRGLAECGQMQAVHDLWDLYLTQTVGSKVPGKGGTAAIYANWLNGKGFLASATGAATITTYTNAAWGGTNGLTSSHGNKVKVTVCTWSQASGTTPTRVYLNIVATAGTTNVDMATGSTGTDGDKVVLNALYVIGAAPWPGLQFGLLTNSVTCVVCHARFDNAARFFNRTVANNGTYPGVRVASLQNFMVRTDHSNGVGDDTFIAGTLFVKGNMFSSETGAGITPGNTGTSLSATNTGVFFQKIDPNTGNIIEGGTSGVATTALPAVSPYATDAMTGSPVQPNQSLYVNYPNSNQPDGPVPSNFPPPIADVNGTGTKMVSNADWTASVANATGTISVFNPTVVAYGSTTSATSLPNPASAITATTFGNSSGTSTESCVILVGTAAKPITISGTVAFGGDVILQGVVQGTGELLVRGNLYMASDVTYNDGTVAGNRTFGVQAGGNPNAVAYAAGGSVLVGNWIDGQSGNPYYSGTTAGTPAVPGNVNSNTSDLHLSFSEVATFNREQWTKTQKYLPTTQPTAKVGGGWNPLPTPDPTATGNVYYNGTVGNPSAATNGVGANKYAWAQNPEYDPTFVPRFYVQNDGNVYIAADVLPVQMAANPYQAPGGTASPVAAGAQGNTGYIYTPGAAGWKNMNTSGDNADIPPTTWTSVLKPAYVTGAANLDTYTGGTPAIPPAVYALGPGSYAGTQWISEATLRSVTNNAMAARSGALKVDGLIYTNNAIFCMAKAGDSSGGRMTVNGSLIAADTGILAPTTFQLNYDVNTKNYINVADPTDVSLTVAVFQER